MPDYILQLAGLAVLVVPLIAIRWNLAGGSRRRQRLLRPREQQRWRLEIYGNESGADRTVVDRADIPFPVKQVRSARGELGRTDPTRAWALPQLELEVVVDDPFTDDVLSGLFGVEHQVRFVTGNEAVVEVQGDRQVRVRALPFIGRVGV